MINESVIDPQDPFGASEVTLEFPSDTQLVADTSSTESDPSVSGNPGASNGDLFNPTNEPISFSGTSVNPGNGFDSSQLTSEADSQKTVDITQPVPTVTYDNPDLAKLDGGISVGADGVKANVSIKQDGIEVGAEGTQPFNGPLSTKIFAGIGDEKNGVNASVNMGQGSPTTSVSGTATGETGKLGFDAKFQDDKSILNLKGGADLGGDSSGAFNATKGADDKLFGEFNLFDGSLFGNKAFDGAFQGKLDPTGSTEFKGGVKADLGGGSGAAVDIKKDVNNKISGQLNLFDGSIFGNPNASGIFGGSVNPDGTAGASLGFNAKLGEVLGGKASIDLKAGIGNGVAPTFDGKFGIDGFAGLNWLNPTFGFNSNSGFNFGAGIKF